MIDNAQIEIAAEYAVPSERQMSIGRWRAHFSSGYIRRINSVAMHGERVSDGAATERLMMIIDVYAERGLRPRLRVTTMDDWIDPMIRRWTEAGEALVMTVDPQRCEVGSTISIDGWISWLAPRAAESGRFDEAAASARMLRADNIVVTATEGGKIVGVGRAVSTNGLTGLFDIMVDPDHRRRGHARSMIDRLRGWAAERDEEVYLQVAVVNRPAITLYESMGFGERYRYRYRSPD